jgi:hypothetical protein
MKKTIYILLFILPFSISNSQENDLTGTWTVFEMTQVSETNSQKMTEDQFRAEGKYNDYYFMENGKFKNKSNFMNEYSKATGESTWKIEGNKLITTIHLDDRDFDIDYNYELKGDTLFLTDTSLNGKEKIIMALRKKQVGKLIGTWVLFERYQIDFGSSPKTTTEAQMKAGQEYADYKFMEDGSYKSKNTYRSTDTITFIGTWKVQDNKVILTHPIQDGKDFVIDWTYELKGDTLFLTRYGGINRLDKGRLTLRKKQI